MIPRKRLDIGWADLMHGFRYCLWPGDYEAIKERLERRFSGQTNLAFLSVRSGFDALLRALHFPAGTEVLVSAVTIRDMARIIESHGLVAVPVDLNMRELAVRLDSMAPALTSRTRAILVAHLFGSRMPMEAILRFADEHGLLVIEDCAQAFAGDDYRGHARSDVTMFSFGPIKTLTALGGGILVFRDSSLREEVAVRQDHWPMQSRWRFLVRVVKYSLLALAAYRAVYSLFTFGCRMLDISHDRIISNRVRGFAGKHFFAQIRQRPSSALLALLERRLRELNHERIAERIALAELAIAGMRSMKRPGDQAQNHTHWVFPILHETPEGLIRHLWDRGFDATLGASSLYVVDPPVDRPERQPTEAKQAFQQLLYLPVDAGMSRRDIVRLCSAVSEFDARYRNRAKEPFGKSWLA